MKIIISNVKNITLRYTIKVHQSIICQKISITCTTRVLSESIKDFLRFSFVNLIWHWPPFETSPGFDVWKFSSELRCMRPHRRFSPISLHETQKQFFPANLCWVVSSVFFSSNLLLYFFLSYNKMSLTLTNIFTFKTSYFIPKHI